MGCGGSKAKQPSDVSVPGEEVEISVKAGSEVKKRVQTIMALKALRKRTLFEKYGVEYSIEESREKLSHLSETLHKSKDSYQFLLGYAMERDADDLFRALTTNSQADKKVLIDVLTARTKWQLNLISEAYERKHHVPLLKKIKENLRTSMGVFTGNNSELGRLLLLVSMDQPERDCQLLTQHLKDFDKIIEIVTTRTNRELYGALELFEQQNNGKSFVEVVQAKSYQNFGKLMKEILECKRSEVETPFDPVVAKQLAEALQEAIYKKHADDVIKIIANLSFTQYKSVNEQYMNMNKRKELTKGLNVFSGDFYQALVARCTERTNYLCSRICDDKDSIPRIFGCLTRTDCKVLRECFDTYKTKYGNGKSLEEIVRAEVKKDSYLTALLNLISPDTSNFPLGTDRELREDELLVENASRETEDAAKAAYDKDKAQELGEIEAKRRELEPDMSKPKVTLHKGRDQTAACIAELDVEIHDLKVEISQIEEATSHLLELSFTMMGHCRQAEEWTALYDTYASQLNSHIEKIDTAAAAAFTERSSFSPVARVMSTIKTINKLKL